MAYTHTLAFNHLDLIKRLDSETTTRDYPNRHVIFEQGDKADAMFYVQNGHVKLTVVSKDGKKAVVAVLQRGDFFGEGCLARRASRRSTATAIQASTIARVKRATMVRIIHREPAFAKVFISYLLFRIGRVEEGLADQIFNSSEKRLARILLLLAGPRAGLEVGAGFAQGEPGNAGRNGWHHAIEGESFHEPIPENGIHRVQRQPAGEEGFAHVSPPRLNDSIFLGRKPRAGFVVAQQFR